MNKGNLFQVKTNYCWLTGYNTSDIRASVQKKSAYQIRKEAEAKEKAQQQEKPNAA